MPKQRTDARPSSATLTAFSVPAQVNLDGYRHTGWRYEALVMVGIRAHNLDAACLMALICM